ncbi:unnamed protein product [Porites lobata]|uniref:Uncharacterized protein n=1 Tax=Porites lobata TaxID=104759 RepID=A0ABN8R1D2_9CNID|nr:unnamed protein product [Porites lobata]
MEEGGQRDPLIPPDEDDDDGDENTTQPFQPDDHSTPGPSSEEIPMTTFSRGREKGPESAETSFIEGQIKDAFGPEGEVLIAQEDKEISELQKSIREDKESRTMKMNIPQRGKEHEKE